ncbi:Potassium channel subfamily K member 4 [Holothuria leucospilota]|uniref:Potassium channel subfamily K member 4 n=1 Tax=Holothuria leucospilota TaxID=206669 RepID=A0A9Q1HFJ1_HOLLE|nr:Potassium channel subfamily K member 4 [Holothuria leucospilota]
MESQGDSEEKFSLRSWHKCVVLFFLLMCFLLLGSFVFCAVEKQHSKEAQQELYQGLVQFLANHPCVSPSDLQFSGSNVSYYLSKGVSLQRRYRIDTKAKEIESTWSLSNAFMLALTIITTIGYGDMVPRTNAGKLFCMLYATAGLPLMACTLSVFGKTLEEFARKYITRLNPSQTTTRCRKLHFVTNFLLTASLVVLFLIVLPGYFVSLYARWEFWESCYFFFITITTIGFGDLTLGDCQRCGSSLYLLVLCFTLYVFVGMAFISFLFAAVSEYQKRKLQTAESLLVTFVTHRHESTEVPTSGTVTYDQSVWRTSREEGALNNARVVHVDSRSSDDIVNYGIEHDRDEYVFNTQSTSSNVSYPLVQLHPRKVSLV